MAARKFEILKKDGKVVTGIADEGRPPAKFPQPSPMRNPYDEEAVILHAVPAKMIPSRACIAGEVDPDRMSGPRSAF